MDFEPLVLMGLEPIRDNGGKLIKKSIYNNPLDLVWKLNGFNIKIKKLCTIEFILFVKFFSEENYKI